MRKRTLFGAVVAVLALIFLVIIGLSIHSSASDSGQGKELRLLHVIMRHGARTPADTYPKDPHINETLYPVGWGQLTNDGKLQMYNLGKFLRSRYDAFLGRHYSPDEYYAQSTDVPRTKATVQTINAGLWPPDESQRWGPLDWQPIPVHAEPLSQDHLLLVRRPCAQYHLELERVTRTEQVQAKFRENAQLFRELSDVTGKAVEDFDDVQDVYSTLRAEEAFNLTIPDFMRPYYPEKLLPPTIFSFVLKAYTDRLKRLKGGILLKKLRSDWRSKADGTMTPHRRKAFLYAGHDSTVVNILSALNVWEPQLPEYGMTVLMEFSLDRVTNDYGLEIFLHNLGELKRLTVPGCEDFCPLQKLLTLTEKVVPDDWDDECRSDDPDYEPPPPGGP